MPTKIDIGLRIREYLDKKRFSYSEVADRIGRSRQALHAALQKEDIRVLLLLDILQVTGGGLHEILGEYCLHQEDDEEMKKYMQDLLKLQKEQINRLEEEVSQYKKK